MIHQLAEVLTSEIGQGTSIWQFCVVLDGAKVGKNCNICSHVFIEGNVSIGNNVTIKNGVNIFDGIVIEDDVFIGPGVVFTNDMYPVSTRDSLKTGKIYPQTLIKKGASIGGGAVILPGIVIGENALIAAGAIVTCDVQANQTIIGHKAQPKA